MQTFQEYILKEGNDLLDRNKAVDIAAIVKKGAKDLKSGATEDELNQIIAYLEKSKTFSLGKMDDTFGSQTVSSGFLKYIITAVKKEIDSAGFGKKDVSVSQSRAQRIDGYLTIRRAGSLGLTTTYEMLV